MPSGRTKAHTRALRHVFTVLHAGVRRHASTQCSHPCHRRRANPESNQVAGGGPILYLNSSRLGSVNNGTNSIYINGLQHCTHPSMTHLGPFRSGFGGGGGSPPEVGFQRYQKRLQENSKVGNRFPRGSQDCSNSGREGDATLQSV
jgi:hypothetical protein